MDAFSNIFSMNKSDAKKAGNFTFITNYFKNPSKQLEEGSDWNQNRWKEFFMGCFMSLLAVMYIGVVSANFIFFLNYQEKIFQERKPFIHISPLPQIVPFFQNFFLIQYQTVIMVIIKPEQQMILKQNTVDI